MKLILCLLLISSAQAQILRPSNRPSTPYNPHQSSNRPPETTGTVRVRTSPSNWNVPGPEHPKPETLINFNTTPTGIVLDAEWKITLHHFAEKNLNHPSWGYSHSERNYHKTRLIAEHSSFDIDEDVLFAASFFHDLGGMVGFEIKGVDHAKRSAQLAIPLLGSWGFPKEKLALVKEVIEGHVYYGPAPQTSLAKAFRDADMLDFLGPMGVARLVAAVSELGEPISIKNSIKTIENFQKDFPEKLSYPYSKEEGFKRIQESRRFLEKLKEASLNQKAY